MKDAGKISLLTTEEIAEVNAANGTAPAAFDWWPDWRPPWWPSVVPISPTPPEDGGM